MEINSKAGMAALANAEAQAQPQLGGFRLKTAYHIECRDRLGGNLKWVEDFENLVVNAGLNDNLDKYFKGVTYTAAFYVGLTSGSPTPGSADTMVTHGGWTEVVLYDEATRPALTLGAVASQSVNNSGTPAAFTISANGTVIGGAFVTTSNVKSGTVGVLYGAGAFGAGNKTLDDNDTLSVTVTLSDSAT
jgi:hypothetical protein